MQKYDIDTGVIDVIDDIKSGSPALEALQIKKSFNQKTDEYYRKQIKGIRVPIVSPRRRGD